MKYFLPSHVVGSSGLHISLCINSRGSFALVLLFPKLLVASFSCKFHRHCRFHLFLFLSNPRLQITSSLINSSMPLCSCDFGVPHLCIFFSLVFSEICILFLLYAALFHTVHFGSCLPAIQFHCFVLPSISHQRMLLFHRFW